MNKNVYVDTIYLVICNSVIHTSVKNASHLNITTTLLGNNNLPSL